jgi:hypothetical protein
MLQQSRQGAIVRTGNAKQEDNVNALTFEMAYAVALKAQAAKDMEAARKENPHTFRTYVKTPEPKGRNTASLRKGQATRKRIVALLKDAPATASEIAKHLNAKNDARALHHLDILEREGRVYSTTQKGIRGRIWKVTGAEE